MKLKHFATIFAFTIFAAFATLYYVAFYEPKPQETNITVLSNPSPKPEGADVVIGIKDEKTLILSWKNLPTGTSRIDIFRAKLACENWSKWRETAIQNPSQGSVEIKTNENISSDCLYFKAVSESGAQLWSSAPLNQIANLDGGSPPPQWQPNGSGTPNQSSSPPPSGTHTPTPTSTSQPQPTSTLQSPQTQNPTSASNPTTTYYYYNPQGGGTTSTNPVHAESFWVEHVNQRIEIGWQNMPSSTQKIVISRGTTPNGPWTKLLEQQGPFENKPYVIRLLDETINSPQYYKLEALSSSGATLQTFGPLLLPALGQ